MHLPTALTAGVSAAAALALLTACGSDSADSRASGSSSSPASSGAAGSGGADVAAFCTESEAVFADLDTAFGNAGDPTELPGLLHQAASALESVAAPAEIESSWTAFSDAVEQLADSAQTIDLGTPEGQDQFTQQTDAVTARTADAQADVDQFVQANCPGAASSSPTG
jgi:hypothetical protein